MHRYVHDVLIRRPRFTKHTIRELTSDNRAKARVAGALTEASEHRVLTVKQNFQRLDLLM
jgi:hypothetical protein